MVDDGGDWVGGECTEDGTTVGGTFDDSEARRPPFLFAPLLLLSWL